MSRDRPDWEDYFIRIARVVATRATCRRRRVGAILVKDRRILATGYNGAPTGIEHCSEAGCLRERLGVPSGERHELCRGLHAEQNVIVQAAFHGIPVRGATLYTTLEPCVVCAKMLINAGIQAVVYAEEYPDPLARELLSLAGIPLIPYGGDCLEDQDDCASPAEQAPTDT